MSPAYFSERSGTLVLGPELGHGREGWVYELAGLPDLCVKIFKRDFALDRLKKVAAMISRPPTDQAGNPHPAVAWPQELVFANRSGDSPVFAGYVMRRARGTSLGPFLNPDRRNQFAGWFTWAHLHRLAQNLAAAISAVHAAGHCVGDLNERNVLVQRNGIVTLVDADSFQIATTSSAPFRCKVFADEYLAPELIDKDLENVNRTTQSDSFALAVMIYQILMQGAHPYKGVIPGHHDLRLRDKIRAGLSPVAPMANGITLPAGAVPLSVLNPTVLALFQRAFGEGHREPSLRPDAATWKGCLRQTEKELRYCSVTPSHVFSKSEASCPWCRRKQTTGLDPFPPDLGWQAKLPEVRNLADLRKAPLDQREQWFRRDVGSRQVGGPLTPATRGWLTEAGVTLGLDGTTRERLIMESVGGATANSGVPQQIPLAAPAPSGPIAAHIFAQPVANIPARKRSPPGARPKVPRAARVGPALRRGGLLIARSWRTGVLSHARYAAWEALKAFVVWIGPLRLTLALGAIGLVAYLVFELQGSLPRGATASTEAPPTSEASPSSESARPAPEHAPVVPEALAPGRCERARAASEAAHEISRRSPYSPADRSPFQGALPDANRAVELDPECSAAWSELGYLKYRAAYTPCAPAESFADAATDALKGLRLADNDGDKQAAYRSLGRIRSAQQRWWEAEQAFRSALALSDDDTSHGWLDELSIRSGFRPKIEGLIVGILAPRQLDPHEVVDANPTPAEKSWLFDAIEAHRGRFFNKPAKDWYFYCAGTPLKNRQVPVASASRTSAPEGIDKLNFDTLVSYFKEPGQEAASN